MPPGGQAEYSWDGDTANLTINFASVGIKKKTKFFIRVQLTDSIEELMIHLKVSKGITGKLAHRGESLQKLSTKMTLAEAGIIPNAILEMESYKAAKRFTHNIPVKLPNSNVINVQVHSGTTIGDLKHKIQDEIGMPVEEQLLEYSGKILHHDKLSVEICGHKRIPFELKCLPRRSDGKVLHQKEAQRQTSAVCRSPIKSKIMGHTDDETVDGPWHESQPKILPVEATKVYSTGDDLLVLRVPNTLSPKENELHKIAGEMVEWEHLAVHLGMQRPKREEIKQDYKQSFKTQKWTMLLEWKREKGSEATWRALVEASLEAKEKELAENIVKIWESLQTHQSTVKTSQPVNPQIAIESPLSENSRASPPEFGSPSHNAKRECTWLNEGPTASKSPRVQHRTGRSNAGESSKLNRHTAFRKP